MTSWIRFIFAVVPLMGCGPKGGVPETPEVVIERTYYPDSTLKELVQKQNGILNGRSFTFNENGTKLWEANYVNGLREGVQKSYDGYGKLLWVENFQNNQLNGWAQSFAGPCGLLKEEGMYLNDKMDGLWYEYYGTELLEVDLYSADSLISVIYRNPKYSDRLKQLPPLSIDCDEVDRNAVTR